MLTNGHEHHPQHHLPQHLPQLVLQVIDLPVHALIGLNIIIQFTLCLQMTNIYLSPNYLCSGYISSESLFSADFLLSLIQLSPHGLHPPIGLLILLLVLVCMPPLVLQLHQQLLDLLLQLPVALGSQHSLLGLS